MKLYLFVLIFILLIPNTYAPWQTYQNDLRNRGIANGTGYFPLKTANFSVDLGMDFQPLVDDMDNDSSNELIIFYNDFLKVFDYELNLLDEKFTGTILGQPTIFNNSIIFNSRVNGKNYFFAYQYNNYFFAYQYNSSGLAPRFNITLGNDADLGGIKCLILNGANSCVFKDKLNYIHIANIDSKTDNSYNTSAYNETRHTVPAIGDIDNDGNMDAVFWHDNNGNKQYGLMAFDLNERKVEWVVDDIFSPSTSTNYALKGQPVLVDLNNDNKLEVAASVFYDDDLNPGYDIYVDWFTELFVYAHNGTKLFSKCETNTVANVGCNDGNNIVNRWEGTNPFVMDYDKNGFDDVCFIKDKKRSGSFKNMTVNCYNYSGDALLDLELSPSTGAVKSAVTADMDNDGEKEIITENRIYANGTSIFAYDLSSNFVMPVELDGNNRLDLIWTKHSMTKLFIDDNGAIKVSDVLIKPSAPSVEDSLSCQWKVNANNKVVSANVSWHRNNELYSNEIVTCINSSLCMIINHVSSALNENDIWKCSVTAFENNKKSLQKSDTAIILGKNIEWTDFNKDRLSYGIAGGNGYFSKSAISTIFYNSSGIDFQPMVADVDNNGENEIVLFANNSLILLNKSLNVIAQKQAGSLRGQFDIENMDNDAFIEIIAVVNNSNQDNFTIFEFNGSSFKIETSFDVTSQNGHQDIRCLDFDKDNAKECIFRDFNGIVHSYQMNSTNANDDGLNVNISDKDDNVFGSKVNIVPSFADFDRDNDLDALFWFNDNFAVIDANKNIVLNVDVGTLNAFIQNEPVFLGLKFVNLDKAGDYEIAVAYRNDNNYLLDMRTEINLSLFNSNGKAIFSKIFDFYTGNCGSAYHEKLCLGRGSDLFIHDYDKDGFDDVGIYIEGAYDSAYGRYIKVSDRNGNEIASNKVEFGEDSRIPQSVTLADIDGDNELEIILERRIYNLDGTAFYNFSSAAIKPPIAVDIDKNKGLDLLWYNSRDLILLLDNNTYKTDLFIEEKDISFQPLNSTSVLVTAIVHNNGLNLDNVKVRLINTETLESVNGTISIKGSSVNNFTAVLKLRNHDKVLAQVNYDSSIEEKNENNNFVFKLYEELPYVYVSIGDSQGLQLPLNEIKNYIKNNLALGYFTDDGSKADIVIYLGKGNGLNLYDRTYTMDKFNWGYESFAVINYFDKQFDAPYAGIAGSYLLDGWHYIAVYGNTISGDIAAAKEFVKRQADLLAQNSERVFVVDDENIEAIGIYDYMQQPGNLQYYGDDSKEFANVVKNALNGETFSTEVKTVTIDGVELRMKHLIPNRSSNYMEVLNVSGVPVDVPVVMARGLWSNLTSWEVFAGELANEGRDVWLIELTGGPGQDCDSCADYTFDDLTDKYVPTLLNAVLNFTGKDKLQYVGFSNGCRATLSSLEKGKFNASKVETFVAVGCPGAFEGTSLFAECLLESGNAILGYFGGNDVKHITQIQLSDQLARRATTLSSCWILAQFLESQSSISKNLSQYYLNLIQDNQDLQPGINLNLNKFSLIYGTEGFGSNNDNDYIVTEIDEQAIFNNIISSNKEFNSYRLRHNKLPDDRRVKNRIKGELR